MGAEVCPLCQRNLGNLQQNQPSSISESNGSRRRTYIPILACVLLLVVYLVLSCHENATLFHTIAWASSSFNILAERSSSGMKSSPLTNATVVTAYYPLSQGSKHSLSNYRAWMENFLPHVEAPVVIYLPSDAEIQATVRTLRGNLPLNIQVCVCCFQLLQNLGSIWLHNPHFSGASTVK